MKPIFLLTLLAVAIVLSACQTIAKEERDAPTVEQVSSLTVLTMIQNGALGEDYAARAKTDEQISITEITGHLLPYRFYELCDYKSSYTVMIDDDKPVLLCEGFGGGMAHDIEQTQLNGKTVITYKYEVGSGISHEYSGQYVMGSGKAHYPLTASNTPTSEK